MLLSANGTCLPSDKLRPSNFGRLAHRPTLPEQILSPHGLSLGSTPLFADILALYPVPAYSSRTTSFLHTPTRHHRVGVFTTCFSICYRTCTAWRKLAQDEILFYNTLRGNTGSSFADIHGLAVAPVSLSGGITHPSAAIYPQKKASNKWLWPFYERENKGRWPRRQRYHR